MDFPSLSAVRARSKLLAARYPVSASPPTDDGLEALIEDASGVISALTGRLIGPVGGDGPFGCPLEDVPLPFTGLMTRMIVVRAERIEAADLPADARAKFLQSSSSNLASFGAGPYSESYFNPTTIINLKALDRDPDVAESLWALATECARDGWFRLWNPTAPFPPAAAVQSFGWFPEGQSGGIPELGGY